ncbi:hypothetical protein QUA32_08940 [Microcoleus sp. Pol14D6]|uniref:hypothetical protein n=1 Tax=unclassified Microcoleus TaxID=2642155 RepID=UPI002FD575F1
MATYNPATICRETAMPCPARDSASFQIFYTIDNFSHTFLSVLIKLKFSLQTHFIIEHHAIKICILAHHPQFFGKKSGRKCVSEVLEEDRQQLLV